MKVLIKFGGVCLTTGKDVQKAADIVKEHVDSGNRVVIVTSAPARLTDELIEIAEKAKMGKKEVISEFISKLESDYLRLASETLNEGDPLKELKSRVRGKVSELSTVLSSVSYLGELTPRTKDLILSFGEALPAMTLQAELKARSVAAKPFLKGDAGIVTDENFGNAVPLMKVMAQKVKDKLLPLLEAGVIPIVAGFIATTQNGLTTTLGRGGSDYTASLIGSSLKVDEINILTDVEGLMTADPKVEPKAVTILSLSYEEASEMVYFGAKSMHPKALEPTSGAEVPIRIRSLFNLSNEGTLIGGGVKSMGTVRALSLILDVALLTVSGAGMVGTPGVAARTFSLLGEKNVKILMISQGSSEVNISFVIPRGSLEQAYSTLELSLLGTSPS
jgi:aspartate kinase